MYEKRTKTPKTCRRKFAAEPTSQSRVRIDPAGPGLF